MIKEDAREVRTPLVIRGIGVGRGIAIGPLRFEDSKGEAKRRQIEESLYLLEKAAEMAREELSVLGDRAAKSVGEEHGEIFQIHLSVLNGEELLGGIKELILKGEALTSAVEQIKERFTDLAEKSGDRREKARAAHVKEVSELLLSTAESVSDGRREATPSDEPHEEKDSDKEKYILIAPGDDGGLFKEPRDGGDIIGIVSVGGTEGSGLAAYAKTKGIPALVIHPDDAPSTRLEGAGAIIDSERGRLTVNPDLAALDRFTESAKEAEETEERLSSLIGLPSVTRSGRYVSVLATVGSESEIAAALSSDAEGIGLLSCDALFSENASENAEELLLFLYKKALDAFKGKPVVAVTYSWGREQIMAYPSKCGVPWMGARGIRFCLAERDLFKRQLRALLRAAGSSGLSVALPSVVSPEEIRRARAVMIETANELKNEGLPYSDKLRLGIIIDTPAAAICGELLAPEVDFFIADTDLLSVFTLAADKRDPAVSSIIKKNPEPVLRLIEQSARAIHSSGKGKRIGISGDLAADPSVTERFISLGADFLSVPPPEVLRIRERVRECPE